MKEDTLLKMFYSWQCCHQKEFACTKGKLHWWNSCFVYVNLWITNLLTQLALSLSCFFNS
jgi:hypothetical protein